jgi:hypothetical protein
MFRSLSCLFAVALMFALSSAAFVRSQEKKKFTPATLMPGAGVADPAAKVGFFPNTTGGIDALDLANGKLLWTSKDAHRPLLASADRLFAQKNLDKPNQIRVVILDSTREGKRVLESETITLPDWVSVTVAYGRSYRSNARLDMNVLFLSWEARAFYAGGARPTPEIEKAARKEASGVLRIDLTTGKFEQLDKDKIAEFFPLANDVNNAKVGEMTLTVKDGPAKNAKNRLQRQRLLQADDANGTVWQHEIAAPVFLPPRP